MLQKGPFSRLMVLILVIGLLATAAYAAHDLACYEIIEPSDDYVQADSAIIPKLGIANLGDEIETSFSVEFIAVDKEEGDTVFADTTIVDYIMPYPNSIEVEFGEWIPEGYCDENEPFDYYELFGIVDLDADEDRTNDTVSREVLSLWSHDVGVNEIEIIHKPYKEPEIWEVGDTAIIAATVENFGFNEEYDIPVRVQITDLDSGDIVLWEEVQNIAFLDWRGNIYPNPYTINVTFTPYILPTDHYQIVTVQTELVTDQCSKDDEITISHIGRCGIGHKVGASTNYDFKVVRKRGWGGYEVFFNLPTTSWVKVDVFDVDGRWVKSIANDIYEPGSYHIRWDGCDAAGRRVATGVYLIRMQADEFKDVQKIVIMH